MLQGSGCNSMIRHLNKSYLQGGQAGMKLQL